MDNIEKALDNFFQRLGHTPGPWFFTEDYDVRPEAKAPIAQAYWTQFLKEETVKANALLISESPAMLRTLCRTYLLLLTNQRRVHLTEILVPLRDQISEATGITSREVEVIFDQYAVWIAIGADVDEQILEQEEKDDMMIREEPADQRDPETKVWSAMQGGTDGG